MPRTLIILAAMVMLSWSAAAMAEQEPIGAEIVPIERGERAPFSGQLFPAERAIRMGMTIERLQLQLTADAERSERLCQAQLDYGDSVLTIERDRYTHDTQLLEQQVEQLTDELSEAREVPWWRSWGFAFGMGVLASAVLVGAFAVLALSL